MIKILNNVGIIGSILAGIADIICVIIFVIGVKIEQELTASILFGCINAFIGVLINILLRYQGQRYAELENQKLLNDFYADKIKKEKKHLSMGWWFALKTIQDIIFKGCTTAFSICGIIYISITGSKNPIQILITFFTLILFACFGFINMSSSYNRFYNVQIPYMNKILNKKGEKENAVN